MMILRRKPVILLLAVFFTALYAFNFPVLAEESTDEIDQEAVDETEGDIESLEKKLEREEGIKTRYEGDLSRTQGAINATQYEINKTDALIEETEETISRKEQELIDLNKRIEAQKEILIRLMQEMYYGTKEPLFNITIKQSGFSQMLGSEDYILTIENKINSVINDIKDSKKNIEGDKEELVDEKESHENLLTLKETEKNNLLDDKFVAETKIAKKELSIGKLQSELNELKNDLNRILGKSYDTGEIKDAIKFANKVTGVRKGFLFGMLKMESGGNPLAGRCTYKNCDMRKDRKKKFKQICKDLGYKDSKCNKMPLSCASKSYPGSGGAMGAAQFMSDTWMGYKSRIASATGSNPPDPWDLLDGVTAMGLYLQDLGANNSGKVRIKNPCNGKKVKVKWEIYASMRYLGWTCYGYTNYAPGIQSLADGYKKL